MSLKPPLLIRCDANERIGVGHVMRCVALAQAWQDLGGTVTLLGDITAAGLLARLHEEGIVFQPLQAAPASEADAVETAGLAHLLGSRWVVLDGYHFTQAHENEMIGRGLKVLTLDDVADRSSFSATVVLNHNAYAEASLYDGKAPNSEVLAGAHYIMLRREFASRRPAVLEVPERATRVLVTMGGSDSGNVTATALQALAAFSQWPLTVTVLVGAANAHLPALERAVASGIGIHEVELMVNAADVPSVMASSDLAITAAGSTGWELACLGVPMMVVKTADNQRLMERFLRGQGAGIVLDGRDSQGGASWVPAITETLISASTRRSLAEVACRLVDGQGARRVAEHLRACG